MAPSENTGGRPGRAALGAYHVLVEPDQQSPTPLQRFVVGLPVRSAVAAGWGLLMPCVLTYRIHAVNPPDTEFWDNATAARNAASTDLPGISKQCPGGWRKIHTGVNEETLEVRVVELTARNVGDAPMLPDLLAQIPSDQNIGSVTADGAYDTRNCHDAIASRGAHTFISLRKNAKPWKPTSAGAVARNEAVNASRYFGKDSLAAVERISSPESRREQEELYQMMGQSVMARDFDRQVAEIQIRSAVPNHYTALAYPSQSP